jgi:hypothetical protein
VSRLFDGVDDLMSFPVAAGSAMNDALSIVFVLRILDTGDTDWLSFCEMEVGGNVRCGFGRNNSSNLYYVNSAGTSSAVNVTDADDWMIVAVTRSTAAATTLHKLPIGGSRTSTAGGALADGLTAASATMKVGGDDDWCNMRLAAVAYWNGVTLTTGELDGILSALTTQSIIDLSPTACYDDSDAFATDLIGSQDRSAIVGTADDADDPAGWVYFGGGAPAAAPKRLSTLGVG